MNSVTDLLSSQIEYNDSQIVPGFVQGKVVENHSTEFKGMIKVEFSAWSAGKNICEWVRVVMPYAGPDYGTYLLPEIGDMVLIGFIGGSIYRPFLLGSIYKEDSFFVSENCKELNEVKAFKTKYGIDITINDKKDAPKITITTKKGSKIVLDDDKDCCEISDKTGENSIKLDFSSGKISMAAKSGIDLKVGETKVTLDVQSINLKSTNVKIDAQSSVDVAALGELKLKGLNTTLEAQATGNIKANAQLGIKGGIVQIN